MATLPEGKNSAVVIQPGGRPRTLTGWNLGGGSEVTPIVTGQHTNGMMAIFEQRTPPKYGVPLHINRREDEEFYILEGKHIFEVDGERHELGPGSHVFFPKGTPHRFQNADDTSGRMLIVCQPAGIEAAFEELAALPDTTELAKFTAICGKFGIEVLGPPLPTR